MIGAEGLHEGRFDSGITYAELVEQVPERFRIDQLFGPITDVWVLSGRQPLDIRALSVWPDVPVSSLFRQQRSLDC